MVNKQGCYLPVSTNKKAKKAKGKYKEKQSVINCSAIYSDDLATL